MTTIHFVYLKQDFQKCKISYVCPNVQNYSQRLQSVYNLQLNIFNYMIRNKKKPWRISITRDQADYLKHKLPTYYSLLQIKNKPQTDMSIEDLIDFEKGGSYIIDADTRDISLKRVNQKQYEVEGHDLTSIGDNFEEDLSIKETLCKIESDFITPINENINQESDGQSQKKTMELQINIQKKPHQQYKSPSHVLQNSSKNENSCIQHINNPCNSLKVQPLFVRQMQKFMTKKRCRTRKLQQKSIIHSKSKSECEVTLPDTNDDLNRKKAYYKQIIKQVKENSYNNLFLNPLPAQELVSLGHGLVDKKLINIEMIQENIESSKYHHLQQLHKDLLLLWLQNYSFKPNQTSVVNIPQTRLNILQKKHEQSLNGDNTKPQTNHFESQNLALKDSTGSFEQQKRESLETSKQSRIALCKQIKKLSRKHLCVVLRIVASQPYQQEVVFDVMTLSEQKIIQIKEYIQQVENQNLSDNIDVQC